MCGALILAACGVLWILKPPSPGWWPFAEAWWLPGGLWTGITQIGSGGDRDRAHRLLVSPLPRPPEAVEELSREIEKADDEADNGADDQAPVS